MKIEFPRQIFEKYSNIKFHYNPYSGSRVVPYGKRYGRTDRPTDMTKLIVVFHNFANAPKNRFSVLKIMSHINLQTRTVVMPADIDTIRYLVIAV